MNTNKKLFVVVGIVVAVVVVALLLFKPATKLGGTVENVITTFRNGIILGASSTTPACLKVEDSDSGGFSYVIWKDGVQTVTGGSASALASGSWVIPAACTNASLVGGR